MCRCILSCTSPSWWSFTHHSSWLLSSPSFPSARSCSPIYLPLLLSHSVLSKSVFYTVQLIAEVRKMPFGNLSPDVLLVGQRIFGCSSGELPQDRQFWEKHDKLPHLWKPSEEDDERLHQTDCSVEREISKTLGESTTRQGYIHQQFLSQADNLLLSLVNCSTGMKGQGENSLTYFCQGRSVNHHIIASGNHSQILLCRCLLHRRIRIFNNWTANKPPLIFKIKKTGRDKKKGAEILLKLAIPSHLLWLLKKLRALEIKYYICNSTH